MSKTWTSEKSNEVYESKETYKLTPETIYAIKDVKPIKTKFGNSFILIDEDNTRFWSNKKVNEFIKSNPNIKMFTLETLEEKQFSTVENTDTTGRSKKKKIIKYFDVKISYD